MNNLVKVEHDKFAHTTTIRGNSISAGPFELNFRHISAPTTNSTVLDIEYRGESCVYLFSGYIIIRLNDIRNHKLNPHESYTDVVNYHYRIESDWYEISKELLKEIAEANDVEIKIWGANSSYEIVDLPRVQFMAQVMYNAVYDEQAYLGIIRNEEDRIQRVAHAIERRDIGNTVVRIIFQIISTIGLISLYIWINVFFDWFVIFSVIGGMLVIFLIALIWFYDEIL